MFGFLGAAELAEDVHRIKEGEQPRVRRAEYKSATWSKNAEQLIERAVLVLHMFEYIEAEHDVKGLVGVRNRLEWSHSKVDSRVSTGSVANGITVHVDC